MVLAAVTSLLSGGPKVEPRVPLYLRKTAAAFGIIAVASGVLAAAVYLFTRHPAEVAALYFALGMGLAAVLTFLASMAWNAWRATRILGMPKRAMEKLENTTDFALNEVGALAREYPKTAAALLAVAGYLVATHAAAGTEKILSALDKKINNLERDTDHEQENYDHRHRHPAGYPDHRGH
jgi:hypothetical protein